MTMDFAAMTRLLEEELPFHRLLGIRVVSVALGELELRIPYRAELIGDTRRPALHGGVISALADVCAGFAVWTHCELDDRIATIDLLVDYLRPATASDLHAKASVRLLGNRVGNARVVLWSADNPEQFVAQGRGVYNIRRNEK
jgi:uncharacterized protein (TIGR00369 family)